MAMMPDGRRLFYRAPFVPRELKTKFREEKYNI